MSDRDCIGLEPAFPAPTNLRSYPSVPAADDAELLERLRNEREPRGRSWEEQAADDAGKPLTGEL